MVGLLNSPSIHLLLKLEPELLGDRVRCRGRLLDNHVVRRGRIRSHVRLGVVVIDVLAGASIVAQGVTRVGVARRVDLLIDPEDWSRGAEEPDTELRGKARNRSASAVGDLDLHRDGAAVFEGAGAVGVEGRENAAHVVVERQRAGAVICAVRSTVVIRDRYDDRVGPRTTIGVLYVLFRRDSRVYRRISSVVGVVPVDGGTV